MLVSDSCCRGTVKAWTDFSTGISIEGFGRSAAMPSSILDHKSSCLAEQRLEAGSDDPKM